VWLGLEHKRLPYELKVMSFGAGDLKTDEFGKLNPRRKIPVIQDGDFALYESAAIMEYLEDAYPESGAHLFPVAVKPRAIARRLIREMDDYLGTALDKLLDETLFKPREKWDDAAIRDRRDAFLKELTHYETALAQDQFLAEDAGAADFTLYPMIALALRIEIKKPDIALRSALGPRLSAWMQRVEALPYFARTIPPHWKKT